MIQISRVIALLIWVAGIVIAKGFFSTLFAIFIPLWAWYLVIERALLMLGAIT